MSDGVKLGQLLCDADIITKRQLSKALQEQVKGRKGTIGEILVDMGFCSFDDITDALMNSPTDTKQHEDKHEEIHKETIQPEMVTGLPPNKPEPAIIGPILIPHNSKTAAKPKIKIKIFNDLIIHPINSLVKSLSRPLRTYETGSII